MTHPWLTDLTIREREQTLEQVTVEVARIEESADKLLELLPATGRNRRHVKQIKHFAELLKSEAILRRVA